MSIQLATIDKNSLKLKETTETILISLKKKIVMWCIVTVMCCDKTTKLASSKLTGWSATFCTL